jgi:WD40 repeat protein
VAVADTESGQWLWQGKLTAGTQGPQAFSPDGRFMASGADDAVVTIVEARTGQVVVTLREHLSEITALAFSEDGRTLASAGKDRTLRLWHAATWRPLGPLRRQGLCVVLHFAGGDLFVEEYQSRWLRMRGE